VDGHNSVYNSISVKGLAYGTKTPIVVFLVTEKAQETSLAACNSIAFFYSES
jgi:hypothetical protein